MLSRNLLPLILLFGVALPLCAATPGPSQVASTPRASLIVGGNSVPSSSRKIDPENQITDLNRHLSTLELSSQYTFSLGVLQVVATLLAAWAAWKSLGAAKQSAAATEQSAAAAMQSAKATEQMAEFGNRPFVLVQRAERGAQQLTGGMIRPSVEFVLKNYGDGPAVFREVWTDCGFYIALSREILALPRPSRELPPGFALGAGDAGTPEKVIGPAPYTLAVHGDLLLNSAFFFFGQVRYEDRVGREYICTFAWRYDHSLERMRVAAENEAPGFNQTHRRSLKS